MGPKHVTPAVAAVAPPLDLKTKLEELKGLKDAGLIDERAWQLKSASILGVEPLLTPVRPPPAPDSGELSLEDSSTTAEKKLASLARSLIGSPEEPVIRGVLWCALMGKSERHLRECVADYANSDRRHQAFSRVFEEAGEGKIPPIFVASAETATAKEQAALLRLFGWLHVSGLAASYLTEVSLRDRPAEERSRFREVLKAQLQESETQGLAATVRRHVTKLLVTEEKHGAPASARKRNRESHTQAKRKCNHCGGTNHTEAHCFKKNNNPSQPKKKAE